LGAFFDRSIHTELPRFFVMLLALHLPDHTLSLELVVAAGILAAIALAVTAWRRPGRPKFATLAAVTGLVFVLQMANFALPGGHTSGHLLGAGIAALLLGPAWGCACLALVLAVQAVVLGDGGVTALGANVLNMAIVGVMAGCGTQTLLRRTNALATAFAAGFVSTVAASAACTVGLAMSGVAPLGELVGAIVGPHLLVGLAEGAFTAAIVWAAAYRGETNARRITWLPLAAAAMIVAALVPVASSQPDTLEATLEMHAK
jgi:cobalt/nickel transport system permease protein